MSSGGTQRLARIAGPSVAKDLIFTARVIDGAEAFRLGVVNYVVDQNEAGDAAFLKALELAEQIAANVCFEVFLFLLLKLFLGYKYFCGFI